MNNSMAVKMSGILMIVVGIALVMVATFFLFYNTWFWVTADSTEGEVVGWEHMETRLGSKSIWEKRAKSSLVLFRDSTGKEIFFTTDVGGEVPLYSKGEKITVLYKQRDPDNAKIRDFKSMYLGPMLLFPFGLVFGFIGMLVQAMGESSPRRKAGS